MLNTMASFVILVTARTARRACADIHTHETTTVILSAHARRGLINTLNRNGKKPTLNQKVLWNLSFQCKIFIDVNVQSASVRTEVGAEATMTGTMDL